MLFVPFPFGFDLGIGASAGYACDDSGLGDFECRVEKEVGLPMLEGGAVGGEDEVECGVGGGGG